MQIEIKPGDILTTNGVHFKCVAVQGEIKRGELVAYVIGRPNTVKALGEGLNVLDGLLGVASADIPKDGEGLVQLNGAANVRWGFSDTKAVEIDVTEIIDADGVLKPVVPPMKGVVE